MGKDDLTVDYTLRHDVIGDARDVMRHAPYEPGPA